MGNDDNVKEKKQCEKESKKAIVTPLIKVAIVTRSLIAPVFR